jgi:hypothetical protein
MLLVYCVDYDVFVGCLDPKDPIHRNHENTVLLAPGAPAIILESRDDRDDESLKESFYFRIKIFNEEGRKYANIEIPFYRGYVDLTNIRARTKRVEQRDSDQIGRTKALEDLLTASVPATSEVKLTNEPDWENIEVPLSTGFTIRISNWTTSTGHGIAIPIGIFSGSERHLFEHAERTHAIYFPYPYAELDDITIKLPDGWKVAALPQSQAKNGDRIIYKMSASDENNTLHISRELASNILLLDKQQYPVFEEFL